MPLSWSVLFKFYLHLHVQNLHSVLWHCWLGSRKSIQAIKMSDEVLMWLSVWSQVQMICIWFSWFHCHSIISCFIKFVNGLPLWCQLTQVVPERGCYMGVIVRAEIPACGHRGASTAIWLTHQDATVWDILSTQSHWCSAASFLPQVAARTARPKHCCRPRQVIQS